MKTNLKVALTKPIIAIAALATIGAGAGASAIASAATAAATNTTAGVTTMGEHARMPGVHGTISGISGTTLTIVDKGPGANGTETTYTVDASAATVEKASQGTVPTTVTLSSLAVGDMVGVQGTVSGTSVTATKIMSGFMGGRGGMGRGHGTDGTVTAINGNTITISHTDGTTYTIDASAAKVTKMVDITVGDIKVGDRIGAEGTVSGTTVTATRIMDGLPEKPAAQQ